MKTKKLVKIPLIMLMMIVSFSIIMGSCKKDDGTDEGDKTALNTLIASSEQIAASATTADYPQAAIDAFKATLEAVKTASAASLTQEEIDALFAQLTAAKNTLMTYAPLSTVISQAEILAASATTAIYPRTAIDNFNAVLLSVKTAAATSLTPTQIDEQIALLNAATLTLNSYATEAYAQLSALITASEEMAAAASTETHPQTAIDDFTATLLSIKNEAATLLTEAQINNLISQLNEAIQVFESLEYSLINEALYLKAGWHFDEGEGRVSTSFSSVAHKASFKAGSVTVFGAEALNPVWVEGLKGGHAVYLNKGAHLEVPYTTDFLPADLSISIWVKPDNLHAENYIISQNYWKGYKLQIQGDGKPFFSYTKAGGGIIDADNELNNSVKAGEWNHLVVSLNSTTKELKFYVNGLLTKTWTEADKGIGPLTQTLTSPDPQPFIIGCMATDAEVVASFMDWVTVDNFGYFIGVVDELKVYSTSLTIEQVSQLYNREKP